MLLVKDLSLFAHAMSCSSVICSFFFPSPMAFDFFSQNVTVVVSVQSRKPAQKCGFLDLFSAGELAQSIPHILPSVAFPLWGDPLKQSPDKLIYLFSVQEKIKTTEANIFKRLYLYSPMKQKTPSSCSPRCYSSLVCVVSL